MKTVCSKQITLERGRRITNNRNMLWAHTLFRRPRSSPNLTLPEVDKRIAMLTAKLKLLDGDISDGKINSVPALTSDFRVLVQNHIQQ